MGSSQEHPSEAVCAAFFQAVGNRCLCLWSPQWETPLMPPADAATVYRQTSRTGLIECSDWGVSWKVSGSTGGDSLTFHFNLCTGGNQ